MPDKIKTVCKKDGCVAIFGDGISGKSVALLMDKMGLKYEFYSEAKGKKNFTLEDALKHSLCVYSPGFRPEHEWLKTAKSAGLETLCEPDFAALNWTGKIYCITGTNGKTTLTSFLTEALKLAKYYAFSAGNIGKPLSAYCAEFYGQDNSQKIAVCEISSFQSVDMKFTHAEALLWTNFAPDHLDWHKDMREYFLAKLRIAEQMNGNLFFIGRSVFEFAKENKIELPCSAQIVEHLPYKLCPKPFDTPVQCENFSLAKAFWNAMNLDENILLEAAKNFSLADFRFGKISTFDGINFMNDSKATNAHAAIAALKALDGEIIWIGGGKNKFCDNSDLISTLKERVSAAFLIGETKEILFKELENLLPLKAFKCNSLDEAVQKSYTLAKQIASKKVTVLFSPAFSSFGMFAGYAERGKSFDNALFSLKSLKK